MYPGTYRDVMGAIPDIYLERIKRFCAEQSPAEFADELRGVHKVRGASVTLAESRASWDGRGAEWIDVPFAQLRFSAETSRWSLYWADRNSKWHPYEDIRPGSLVKLLLEIDKDLTGIFKG